MSLRLLSSNTSDSKGSLRGEHNGCKATKIHFCSATILFPTFVSSTIRSRPVNIFHRTPTPFRPSLLLLQVPRFYFNELFGLKKGGSLSSVQNFQLPAPPNLICGRLFIFQECGDRISDGQDTSRVQQEKDLEKLVPLHNS